MTITALYPSSSIKSLCASSKSASKVRQKCIFGLLIQQDKVIFLTVDFREWFDFLEV
jgi:hypothetical protein